jgi:dihydrofolate synthase/folylpolyglutamate synthase
VGFLGDTLEKIASEKAGIIKPNTPVIIGEALPGTRAVFETKAKEENAAISFAEEKYSILFDKYANGKMQVKTSDNKLFTVGLNGLYQLKNIATVFTAVEQLNKLNFQIPENSLEKGLEQVVEITGLQGRWQVLQQYPTVVTDTGHNVGGIRYVVEQLKAQQYETLHIVIGMVNDKDVSSVLALLPTEACYYFTQANIIRALPAEELLNKAKSYNLNGNAYNSVKEAVYTALNNSTKDDLVFIGGSNFVVGEALGNVPFK